MTTATIDIGTSPPPPRRRCTRSRGVFHDTWVIARRGLIHMKRQPEPLSDATIQPIMFVLLFAYVFGGAIPLPGGNYREYLMGGIFAQTIVFTCFGVALALANDRKNNAVDRFRSLPIAKGAVLGGHAIANLLKSLLPIVLMSLCGLLVGWRIRSGVARRRRRLPAADRVRLRDDLGRRAVRQPRQDARGGDGHRLRRAVPADVRGQHVRAAHPRQRRRQVRGHDARRAADDRRVEPGDDARQRRAHPVRQPGRRPGSQPAVVDRAPGRSTRCCG